MSRAAAPRLRGRSTTHEGFLPYRRFRWLKVALLLGLVALLVYVLDRPVGGASGGTAYGYTTGTIGALLIVWLSLLGVRKRWMTAGRWSLKGWTSAHVYLGLALVVVATLHTGFRFGTDVHTLAYALMLLVIASGVVGTFLYGTLPRLLSDNRGEVTERQMVTALAAIDRRIGEAALPLGWDEGRSAARLIAETPFAAGAWRRLSGRYADRAAVDAQDRLAGTPVAPLLRERAGLVHQIERHLHLRALLDGWLYLHVPVTFALFAALTAHIVAVFFYW